MTLDVEKLDFDHCEDEPIHIPESIQSYGYLFALDQESGEIRIISENVVNLLGDTADIIGRNFFDLLDQDKVDFNFLKETYRRARNKRTRFPIQIKFREGVVSNTNETDFYAVVYDSDDCLVIELEPEARFRESYSAKHYIKLYAMGVAPKFKEYRNLGEMAQEIVDTIKYITNMDRVVLYRFNDDASGQVIAEARNDDMESYLDLFYPASDIPAQARHLYKVNWVRLTPNVELESARLIPTIEEKPRKPLDMTHSILRSLSPIHRQYVRNQGLKASMSMSLVTHNDLWGIISCHSREATYLPQNIRLECENLCQLFSWHLYAKEEELLLQKKDTTDHAINRMLDRISSEQPITDVFEEHQQEVLEIMEADGFIFYSEPQVVSIGVTPDLELVEEIHSLAAGHRGRPFLSADVSQAVSDPGRLNGIRGVLLIPLMEQRDYFTIWFRKERKLIQKWAGVPNEKQATGSKKERLTPRSSFKVHVREITGRSKEWDQDEINIADRYNRLFMAYALEMQDKMRKNLADMKEQDRYKNEFLATLAHELRNPLAPISTGISLLEQAHDKSTRSRILASMKRQVDSMTTMINDLMDVSRITRGRVNLEKQDIAIGTVIEEAVDTVESLMREKGHHLKVEMPDQPLYVNGDRTRLAQVFANILNNAAKYTDPGGRIHLHITGTGSGVGVRVRDNGLGIPADKIEQIFTMFTQVDAHSPRAKGGLGIGLTLVSRLVELHGGRVTARSEGVNRGSEFEVILPRVEPPQPTLEAAAGPGVEAVARRLRILVVDDNVDILDMYSILLEVYGYQVETATSAAQAIEKFRALRPRFALLDIGLPDMDGYQLCRVLAGMPQGRDTVFFSQSGWGSQEDIKKAREAGFREHLVKPVDSANLHQVLQKHAPGE